MPLILRIDVDNPFGWHNKSNLILNYISLNWTTVLNRVQLGFLSHAHDLLNYLNSNDINAIWFFTLRTLPDRFFLEKLKKSNQEIALHNIRSDTIEQLKTEIKKINSHIGDSVRGFSKHGSGTMKLSRQHTPNYDEQRFINYALDLDLRYFLGNEEKPSTLKRSGSIIYWSGCFWANPERRDEMLYDLNWLKDQSKSETIVFLIHPFFWKFNEKIRHNLDWIIKNIPDIKLPDLSN